MGYEHYQMPKPPPAETSSMYVSKTIYLSVYQKGQYIISFYLLHPFPELETNNPTVFIQALVFNLCTCFLVYTTVNFIRYNFRYSIKVSFLTFLEYPKHGNTIKPYSSSIDRFFLVPNIFVWYNTMLMVEFTYLFPSVLEPD